MKLKRRQRVLIRNVNTGAFEPWLIVNQDDSAIWAERADNPGNGLTVCHKQEDVRYDVAKRETKAEEGEAAELHQAWKNLLRDG